MSTHKVNIDVQEIAYCMERVRKELSLIEYIVQQALLEGEDDGNNVDQRVDGVG